MAGRCYVCWCPEDFHKHLTHPGDLRCGTCGPLSCPAYMDPEAELPKLTADQRRTRQIAEERASFNALCLLPFTQSSQQVAAVRIPRQRPQSVADYLYERRRGGRKADPRGRPPA